MTARLWWVPGAASLAVHMVLEETGEPYELRRREGEPDDPPPPELLALNPDGRVPVLEVDAHPVEVGPRHRVRTSKTRLLLRSTRTNRWNRRYGGPE